MSIVNLILPDCQEKECVLSGRIKADITLSWPEAAFLINKETGQDITDVSKVIEYKNIFAEYFKNHLKLSRSSQFCNFELISMPVMDLDAILFNGVQFEAIFNCDQTIKPIVLNELCVESTQN